MNSQLLSSAAEDEYPAYMSAEAETAATWFRVWSEIVRKGSRDRVENVLYMLEHRAELIEGMDKRAGAERISGANAGLSRENEIIKVPQCFRRIKKMGRFDEGIMYDYEPFRSEGEGYIAVIIREVDASGIPDDNWKSDIIKAWHADAGVDSLLLEVHDTRCKSGAPCRCVIAKCERQTAGRNRKVVKNHYQLYASILRENTEYRVIADSFGYSPFFDREYAVLNMARRAADFDNPYVEYENVRPDNWEFDPYPCGEKPRVLMNMAETRKYDFFFPNNPLTLTRKFLKYLLANN